MGRGPRRKLSSNLPPRALLRMLLRATFGSIRYVVGPAQLVVGTACGQMAILHPKEALLSITCEFVIGIGTQLANLCSSIPAGQRNFGSAVHDRCGSAFGMQAGISISATVRPTTGTKRALG